jgi:aerotaxis receptor
MKPKPINEEITFEDVGVENRPIICRIDLKGVVTYVNNPFCKLSGYSKEELIGKPIDIIKHPDMPKSIFKQMWNTIERGEKFRGFIKNLRKDGKYYWAEVFIEPVFDENGIKVGYISMRKKMSESDKIKYEQLYKEMKEKEE